MKALPTHTILSLCFCAIVSCQLSETTVPVLRQREGNPIITHSISNQQVNAFAEDAQGHIWIGTFRGLNKFNIHEYQQYYCMDDSISLPDNQIKDVLCDSKSRLWISTVNGLCLYTDRDTFKHIPSDCSDNKNGVQLLESRDGRIFVNYTSTLSVYNPISERLDCVISELDPKHNMRIKCFISPDEHLWVATPENLYCYDLTTYQLQDRIDLSNHPWYYHLTQDGMLWLTGNQSIKVFDTRKHCFVEVPPILSNHPVLSQSDITIVHPYGLNSLLLYTTLHGMFCYNFTENTVVHQREESFPFEVPEFSISTLFTDSSGNLWIGSVDQGYTVSYHSKKRFNNDNYLRALFNKKSVVSVASDSNDILWITTLNDGLYRYDLKKRRASAIDITKFFPQATKRAIRINQLLVDNTDNALWMTATSEEVLKCGYTEQGICIEARYPVSCPLSMQQDESGNIWIGTATPYIYCLPADGSSLKKIKAFDTQKGSPFTFTPGLQLLKDGSMLVAAFYKPLTLVDPTKWEAQKLQIDEQYMQKCIKRSVFIPTVLYSDSKGDIWIGTVSNGLLRYSPLSQTIEPISGAACTDISSIEEDLYGNLWVSTLYGLSKYDRTNNQFTNYYEEDGIGGNQFYDRSSCKLRDGTLVFGGTHGLTIFNPLDLNIRDSVPLLFENLKIRNQLIKPNSEAGIIDKHLSYRPDINLNYDQNGFSISFTALAYSEQERIHYYYKLENFDRYWIDANGSREAHYANLPVGRYKFKVRVMDNDSQTVEAESFLRVIVRPAPWCSWWAYTLYSLLGASIILLFLRARHQIKLERGQVRRVKQEKEQEEKLNRMNMSFFANVSHEFRTPLTMISGPVSQLCKSPQINDEDKRLLQIVHQSIVRMLNLVNQLMDFNKLENDTLKLKVRYTDIVTELKYFLEIFRINVRSKNITLHTHGMEGSFPMWVDTDKLDKIITNLLSNALKFTPSGGFIEVSFDVVTNEEARQIFDDIPQERLFDQYIKIQVTDTGIGIPSNQTERIFERYYQLNNKHIGSYNWGTGIGLYYARSLANLHHGFLKADNRHDRSGAIFTLILPTDERAYSYDERDTASREQREGYPLKAEVILRDFEEEKDHHVMRKKILVVDDDPEVAYYLKVLLAPTYRISCHFDAQGAFNAIREEAPDLVLSDVVMPGTDGYTLCRLIKEDLQLCHIPVILVTAKSEIEHQVAGLNTGANAYVTKPFDPAYLKALIRSQLTNQEKVRSLLSLSTQTDTIADDVLSPQDKAFMTDLYQLMEAELSNPELSISHMTEKLHISRTKFYYKVKGLTGQTPSTFFKTYKLNRAAELIKEGHLNISEIADMTGFSIHSHFSKTFKSQFGVAPSKYK